MSTRTEARLAARIGLAALADAHRRGARLGVMDMVFAIGPGAPQVVDMRGRDRGQSFVLGLAMDLEFALEDAAHGRSREAFVSGIGLGQQLDIGGRITVWEAVAPRGSRLDYAALAPAGDQTGDLRFAESADLDQIAAHDSFVLFRQLQVLLGAQGTLEKAINLLAAGVGEAEIAAGVEEFSHLGEGEMFGMLHGDLHSPALCPDPT